MKRIPLLCLGLVAASCGVKTGEFAVLKKSSFAHPYPEPLTLYVAQERDRSGRNYVAALEEFGLATFRERLIRGLEHEQLTLDTYTDLGSPVTLRLHNPFTVVVDSVAADLILSLRIEDFDDGKVDVTPEKVTLWRGQGYPGYASVSGQVSRAVVALHARLREAATAKKLLEFRTRGISVGTRFRHEAYAQAMHRCEIRFYERLLRK